MADEEFAHLGFAGYFCGLPGGAVVAFAGFFPHVIEVGGFVIDHICIVDMGDDVFVVARVGAESIFLSPFRRGGNGVVRDGLSARGDIVQSFLEAAVEAYGYIEFPHFIDEEFPFSFFFFEHESVAFDAVGSSEAADADLVVIDEDLVFGEGVKGERVGKMAIGHFELHFNNLLQWCGSVDVQLLFVGEEAEGVDESNEAEVMVAMEVGNKDV